MMNETMIKKIESLVADEAVFEKIQAAGSDREIYDVLCANGVECTYEEFAGYMDHCRKVMQEKGMIAEDGELSVEMLEAVSGGSARGRAILATAGFFAAYCGNYPVAGICLVLAMLH